MFATDAVLSSRREFDANHSPWTVYRGLLNARAVATWMVPTGMTSHVHSFDPREGGTFRISLTYDAPTGTGKTTAHADTYHGGFVELVPNERLVEVVEFETMDPALRGEMTITIAPADADGETDVIAVYDGVPRGVPPADNEAGWRSSLANRIGPVNEPPDMARVAFWVEFAKRFSSVVLDSPPSVRLGVLVPAGCHMCTGVLGGAPEVGDNFSERFAASVEISLEPHRIDFGRDWFVHPLLLLESQPDSNSGAL